MEYGAYETGRASCDKEALQIVDKAQVIIKRGTVESMDEGLHKIEVELVPLSEK